MSMSETVPRQILIVDECFDPLKLQADYQSESMGEKTDYPACHWDRGVIDWFNANQRRSGQYGWWL